MKISRDVPTISHLLYVDDIMITVRANARNASTLAHCLEEYGKWSRQKVSLEKSSILFSLNLGRMSHREIKQILGLVYLGNSLIPRRNK